MSRFRNPFRALTIEVEAWIEDADNARGDGRYRWQVYRDDVLIEAGYAKTKTGWVLKLWLVAMRYRVMGVAA